MDLFLHKIIAVSQVIYMRLYVRYGLVEVFPEIFCNDSRVVSDTVSVVCISAKEASCSASVSGQMCQGVDRKDASYSLELAVKVCLSVERFPGGVVQSMGAAAEQAGD